MVVLLSERSQVQSPHPNLYLSYQTYIVVLSKT